MRRLSWRALLVVVAIVAVTAWCALLLSRWPPAPPGSDLRFRSTTPAQDDPADATADEKLLVVLGDSFSAPSDASDGPEWPALLGDLLGWEVVTEAVPGSGFVSGGEGQPFGPRVGDVVAHAPAVIVVAGGEGDLGPHPVPQVTAAAESVIALLLDQAPEAQLVVVSPFSNGEPGPLTREFSGNLQQITASFAIPYVDATRWLEDEDLFGRDPDHPADAGQQLIATRMQESLTALEVALP